MRHPSNQGRNPTLHGDGGRQPSNPERNPTLHGAWRATLYLGTVLAMVACNGGVGTSQVHGGDREGMGGDSNGGSNSGDDGHADEIGGDSAGWDCTLDAECTSPTPCESGTGASCVDHLCVYAPLADTTGCDDLDPCTENDHCDGSGSCVADTLSCATQSEPDPTCEGETYVFHTELGACDTATGSCFLRNELPCDPDCVSDCLNACAGQTCPPQNDGCRLGSCVPDPPGFACVYADAATGAPCDFVATGDGSCLAGTCEACVEDADCPACLGCSATHECTVLLTDDDACGTIDCDGLNPDPCRLYHDLDGNAAGRCDVNLGACKTPNSADCTEFTVLSGECRAGNGSCDPAESCDGSGNCPSNTFAAADTPCATCQVCDGSGNCDVVPNDDDACGIIACDGLNTECLTYDDLDGTAVGRCEGTGASGNCKDPNSADCTESSWLSGTCDLVGTGDGVCFEGACVECTGPGDCSAPTPICYLNSCVQCTGGGDCSAPAPICYLNSCVECTNAGHCPDIDPYCYTFWGGGFSYHRYNEASTKTCTGQSCVYSPTDLCLFDAAGMPIEDWCNDTAADGITDGCCTVDGAGGTLICPP